MPIDRSKRRSRRRSVALLMAAAAAAAALEISGCGKPDSSDPSAAPYGASAASASPSAAAAQTGVSAPAAASPGQTAAAAAPTSPADPVGPDTKIPSSAPPAAPPGDTGSDVKAPPMSGGGPMMGMGSSPTAPLTPTPDLDAKVAAAEKSGSKTAIGDAYAVRGSFRMNDANAGAKVKYRAALDDYRKALKADPANPEAKQNKDLIEGIYKQMGRPIPGA